MWLLSLLIASQIFASDFCRNIFLDRKDNPNAFVEKVKYAKEVSRLKLDAYVSQWAVREKKYEGPFPATGETLVVGVNAAQAKAWMRKIGMQSIGFGVHGLPESNPGSAYIRVADKFYYYSSIQRGEKPIAAIDALFKLYQEGYTEATFMVRPEEIKAMQEFFVARAKGITAKHDVRNGPKKGEVIDPRFDHEKANLSLESCAGACSSVINDKWLAHYEKADVLIAMKERLGLVDSHVAKHFIWKHARNQKLASLTLFALSESNVGLESGIMQHLEWGLLRGMPVYALVPDLKNSKNSKTLWTQRISLKDWLEAIAN